LITSLCGDVPSALKLVADGVVDSVIVSHPAMLEPMIRVVDKSGAPRAPPVEQVEQVGRPRPEWAPDADPRRQPRAAWLPSD
jgi:hypothetical protein